MLFYATEYFISTQRINAYIHSINVAIEYIYYVVSTGTESLCISDVTKIDMDLKNRYW